MGDIDNWMLKSDISEGAKIPQAILVKPGSEEYIKMSAKPGSIVYGFSIKKNDSYLFNNAQAGGGVDIYLAYNLRVTKDESGEIKTAPVTDATDHIAEFDPAHSVLVGDEGQWPIDNRNILSTAVQSATTIQNDSEFIREFRGENSANSSINSK